MIPIFSGSLPVGYCSGTTSESASDGKGGDVQVLFSEHDVQSKLGKPLAAKREATEGSVVYRSDRGLGSGQKLGARGRGGRSC